MLEERRRELCRELKANLMARLAAHRVWVAQLPIVHVQQLDKNGCGIACVAMLANVTYARAKLAVKERRRSGGMATNYVDIRFALTQLGAGVGGRRRKFSSWKDIEGLAIVAVEQVPRQKSKWHWVVFDHVEGTPVVWDPALPGASGVREYVDAMQGRHYMLITSDFGATVGASRGDCRGAGGR